MAVPRSDQLLLGLMGKKRSGKSTVAQAIREAAGSNHPACDLEFSDPILEAINHALAATPVPATGTRDLTLFRQRLIEGAHQVVGLGLAFDPLPSPQRTPYHNHKDADCPECCLAFWLALLPRSFREVNRENKADNRPPQSWLGVIARELAGERIWAQEVGRRIERARQTVSLLITVGGVRFPSDALQIRQAGGIIVEIVGADPGEDGDPTNALRHLIEPEVVLQNTAVGLEYAEELGRRFWADLIRGKYLPKYSPLVA